MAKAKESAPAEAVDETVLPVTSNSKKVKAETVTLSAAAVSHYGLGSDEATLVEKGEVESVVKVDGESYVVGNEEVS